MGVESLPTYSVDTPYPEMQNVDAEDVYATIQVAEQTVEASFKDLDLR